METFSYFTILSNWIRGFDKYQRIYSKELIKESSFPNEFYLLKPEEYSIGLEKAQKLLKKTDKVGDAIIKINVNAKYIDPRKNNRNGRGWVIDQNFIEIDSVEILEKDNFELISIEELTSKAYVLEDRTQYKNLVPRTISYLPIAQACQAKCWFCFSESSISKEKDKGIVDLKKLESYLIQAKEKGAERFVITGGGEPGLLNFKTLLEVISLGKKYFNKIVLISNGMFLSYKTDETREKMLKDLEQAGLTVLSISRHHHNPVVNKSIMGIDTKTEELFFTLKRIQVSFDVRIICVLQQSGIDSVEAISSFVSFAKDNNVKEICFKELYVSSSLESLYVKTPENQYSRSHQVPLKTVLDFCKTFGFRKIAELPWKSPIFELNGVKIAAYTEPSVGWELSNGICRSWNVMADMKNYASLEDSLSLLETE